MDAQGIVQRGSELVRGRGRGAGQSAYDELRSRWESPQARSDEVAQPTPHAVAHYRSTHGPRHHETRAGGSGRGGGGPHGRPSGLARVQMGHQHSRCPASAATAGTPRPQRRDELVPAPQPGSGREHGQADSRERPLARRPARMARPARVRIRRRNPWVFARRRLFGWKVRLLTRGLPYGGLERRRRCRVAGRAGTTGPWRTSTQARRNHQWAGVHTRQRPS